jgi:hypothetical protein
MSSDKLSLADLRVVRLVPDEDGPRPAINGRPASRADLIEVAESEGGKRVEWCEEHEQPQCEECARFTSWKYGPPTHCPVAHGPSVPRYCIMVGVVVIPVEEET